MYQYFEFGNKCDTIGKEEYSTSWGERVIMNEETLQLFKTLTELPGAPGNEHAVRKFMRTELEKYSDEIVQDNLGASLVSSTVMLQTHQKYW